MKLSRAVVGAKISGAARIVTLEVSGVYFVGGGV